MAQAKLTRSHLDERENWKRGMALCAWPCLSVSVRMEEEETREPEEPEQISAWVGEKCDMLPTNGVAASHTPGRHGSSAAANRGLDMIFSSAVSSARPLSLIFACLESWSRMLHTECSWHADLWWVQIQVCAFFSFGWRFRQDVLAFLIRFLTPLLSTSMITKATSCQGFKKTDLILLHYITYLLGFSHVWHNPEARKHFGS